MISNILSQKAIPPHVHLAGLCVHFVDSSFQMKLFKSSLICGGNCSGCWKHSRPKEKHPSGWYEEPFWRQRFTFCRYSRTFITHYGIIITARVSIREGGECLVNMEMWLMADARGSEPLLSHVWCLHIVVIRHIAGWFLYRSSAGCKTPHVRSYKMWVSALFPGMLLQQGGLHISCVESHREKTWNKLLHKL